MKKVYINYSIRKNIGDAINPLILERVLGVLPVHADPRYCEVSGIGSGLDRFFYNPCDYSGLGRMKRNIYRNINRKRLVIWSSGFISTPSGNEKKYRQNTIIAGVRGKLSLNSLKLTLGASLTDAVTGDAGLLTDRLLDRNPKKEYILGIIPHDNERTEREYIEIKEKIPNSVIIDVQDEPIKCIQTIAACECVISSSLHGLVIADAFGIPNRQVVLTNKLAGDGFKFKDYYSAFDKLPNPIDLRTDHHGFDLYDIFDTYSMPQEEIAHRKDMIVQSFNKYVGEQ